MKYEVNHITLNYETEGERITGSKKIMLEEAIDLTAKTHWTRMGFTIQQLFSENLFNEFEKNTYDLITGLWRKAGLQVPPGFPLDQYHTLTPEFKDHLRALDKTKLLQVSEFPIPIKILEGRISEICDEKLEVRNPFDGQSIFHFRVVRPETNDNNPLHRDVWLEDYDDCINLYIPVAGSNENSSLILVPESHRWEESEIERTKLGALINGIRFNVPAVTAIHRDFKAIRGNPQKNEVLVFSPYLIHGGSINLDPHNTRISIEVRLWKKSGVS